MRKPNKKLLRARQERDWKQSYVAHELDTNAFTVSRWERGVQPPSAYYQKRLCQLFEMTEDELGFFDEDIQDAVKFWYVPYSRNTSFTDFNERVQKLRDRFTIQVPGSSRQSISGLGGIGKTELALEYAYRYREEYTAIFWLRAGTKSQLLRDFIDIAHLLQVPEANLNKPDERYLFNEVIQWLNMHGNWLMILDNVDVPEEKEVDKDENDIELYKLLSTLEEGHILLTTRSQSIARLAQNTPLEGMTLEEGALLLLLQANQASSYSVLEKADDTDRKGAFALAQFLEGLPLALEQARAYIEANKCGLARYRQLCEKYRKELLRYLLKDSRLYREYGLSVATTWLISFERVKQSCGAASDMLKLYAYLAPDAIPDDTVLSGASILSSDHHQLHLLAGNELQFTHACQVLLNYSLIKRNIKGNVISIHRLIQDVIQDNMDDEEQHFWVEQAVLAVEFIISKPSFEGSIEVYIPHIRTCAKFIKQLGLESKEVAHLLEIGAHAINERGWSAQARPLYLRAFDASMAVWGEDDPCTLHRLLDVAKVHMNQGALSFAARVYNKAKSDLERLGAHYLDIVTCLNSLALSQLRLGKRREAEQICSEAFVWHRRVPVPDVVQQSETYHVAAQVSESLQLINRAEAYYQAALKLREKALGADHSAVSISLYSLGTFYLNYKKDLSQSEILLQRALKIRQNIALDHPDTADCLVSLGRLCWERENYAEAEEYYMQAYDIRQQKLGPFHTDVLACLHDLAELAAQQRKDEEAEQYYREAFKLSPNAGGTESYGHLFLLGSYAGFLQKQGRISEAKTYRKQYEDLQEHLFESGQLLSQALSDEDGQSTPSAHIWSFER